MDEEQKKAVLKLARSIEEDAGMLIYCLTEMRYYPGEQQDPKGEGILMSLKANFNDLKLYAPGIQIQAGELCELLEQIKKTNYAEADNTRISF